jgi:hypothetical protein
MGTLGWIIFLAFFIAAMLYVNRDRAHNQQKPPVFPKATTSAVAK